MHAWQPVDLDDPEEPWPNVDPAEGLDLPTLLELLAGARPRWMARAACRGQGPGPWFPERGESLEPAREVCAGCEVRPECAEAGMGERGIWAGQSERQRRQARREAA
jgi:WhiB family transcriptional regulator, redox-sensing transcriptional regulator